MMVPRLPIPTPREGSLSEADPVTRKQAVQPGAEGQPSSPAHPIPTFHDPLHVWPRAVRAQGTSSDQDGEDLGLPPRLCEGQGGAKELTSDIIGFEEPQETPLR